MYTAAIILFVCLSLANGQGNGAIRLVRFNVTSSSYSAGIVQIYYNSVWGNICDDTPFGYSEANVICHQLGYTGVSTYGNTGTVTSYGTDTNPTAIEDVSCTSSSYLALLQCSVTSRYSSYCNSNSRDAYVSCYSTRIWSSPYSGQIRLQGGTYSNYGRLEVYCNSQWGTVCDNLFGSTDATVACRQLGYGTYYTYTGNLAGSTSQPIWLNNVYCSSSSTSCLAYCQSCPSSQIYSCNHNEDVALGCAFSTSSFGRPTTTTSTCRYADTTSSIASSIGGIVAGVVIGSFVICVLIIAIPLCVCCCLGVGIGSAARGSSRTVKTTYTNTPTQPTVAVVNETVTTYPATGYDKPSAPPNDYQPPPYPPQPAPAGYPPTAGYPPQDPGYPQQPPAAYPQQPPAGYPQQPPAGYPQQPPSGYPIQDMNTGYPQQPPPGYQPAQF